MKNQSLNVVVGLVLGTFFSTEVVYHPAFHMSDSAYASVPVFDATAENFERTPSTFAPSTNTEIVTLRSQSFDKNAVLSDFENRISDEFKIPEDLKARVSFWFDIYTKYSAQEQVIHHADYPWIVFRVIDVRPIMDGPGNRWTKYHKSVKYSRMQRQEVRNILTNLSKKKNVAKLSHKEREIYNLLLQIPGKNRRKVAADALKNMRAQLGQKDFIEKGLESSSLYLPELEKVFAEQNLPLELTRLPFVESSFNVNAVSKVGASGIWQVMPYIGKKMLLMNNAIDERNSPVKAADSAAFILKQNKQILKNWPLALTAYNHGVGSLSRGVKKTGSRDLSFLIKNYKAKSFGFASQNFFSSFLAVLHAEKYKEHIYNTIVPHDPLKFRELKLTQSIKLKKLLQFTGLSKDAFQKYNLDIKNDAFRKNMTIPRGYVVHIPDTIITEFLAKKQKFGKLIDVQPPTSTL